MKVTIIEPYGYCAGVANAISLAYKVKKDNPNRRITILGMLIHNEDTISQLEKDGINTLYSPDKSLLELIDDVGHDDVVILTAHGHAEEVENKLRKLHIEFVDTTCPFVKLTFNEIKKTVLNGHEVIYIGKKNHPEANAAISISPKVHLLDISNKTIPNVKDDEPLIINQTTFSHLEIESILDDIKKLFPNAKIFKSVCDASSRRQDAILSLPSSIELIYVVGGKKSNNAKTLYELARNKYPKVCVKLIQNENDINEKDLIGLNQVAISSGASTPREITEKIKAKIESLCN